jgi:glycosyltransferase involved in cell wall biosynthesis
MNQSDLVSVLIVSNNAAYLSEAIESVCNQDYEKQKMELVLVLDRLEESEVKKIIPSSIDLRIKILKSSTPGVVHATNLGLETACGEYVAILDSDDLMLPNRISSQIAYLKRHPNITAVGGHIILIDSKGENIGFKKYQTTSKKIRRNIFEMAQMAHPAVTYRKREVIEAGGYRLVDALDIDLWIRIIEKSEINNLDLPMIKYRIHENNFSKQDVFKTNIPRKIIWMSHFLRRAGIKHDLPSLGEEKGWLEVHNELINTSFITRLALSDYWNMNPIFMNLIHKYKTSRAIPRIKIMTVILRHHRNELAYRLILKLRRIMYIKFFYRLHKWS